MKRLISLVLSLALAVGTGCLRSDFSAAVAETGRAAYADASEKTAYDSDERGRNEKTVNLTVDQGADFSAALSEIKSTGVKVVSVNSALFSVTVKGKAKELVKAENLGFVKSFYVPGTVQKPRPVTEKSSVTQSPETDEISDDGAGTVIAVIDTGFNLDHETMTIDNGTTVAITESDAKNAIERLGYGAYYNQKIPFYFNYADANYQMKEIDNDSHGMKVASLAAGNSDTLRSYAKNAQLLLMRVFSDESEQTSDFLISKAVADAVDLGADVINLSLGGYGGISDNQSSYAAAVDYAEKNGVLVVAAAGNEGNVNSKIDTGNDSGVMSTPGDLKNALSVGAISNNGKMASFSSFGPNSDLSFGNKLVAEGVSVMGADNEGYSEGSGTSFASPITAAAAALVMKKAKALTGNAGQAASLAAVFLENGADPIDDFNFKQAAGKLNVRQTLKNNVAAFSQSGTGLIELGQISKTDAVNVAVTLKNYSNSDVTLSVFSKNEYAETSTDRTQYRDTGLDIKQNEITVPAGGSVEFSAGFIVGENVPEEVYITGHLCFEGNGNIISCPYLGYYGQWDKDPVISTRDDETGLSLYSFDGGGYVENSVISANGDGVNDFLFPFFFQLRSAEYVKVDIYSENMEFISNAAYCALAVRDQYSELYDVKDSDPVTEKAALYLSGLGFNSKGFDAQTGEFFDLANGKYFAVIEAKLCFEGARTERYSLPFFVTDDNSDNNDNSDSNGNSDNGGDADAPDDSYNSDGPGGPSDNVFEGVDFSDDDIALYDVYGAWKTFGTEQEQPSAEIYQTVLGKLNVDADYILYRFEDGETQSEMYIAALDEQKRFAVEAGLSQGKYKRMIFTAEKHGRTVAQRSVMLTYDPDPPITETDLKKISLPDWLDERLDGRFDGLCLLSDYTGKFRISAADGNYYPINLSVNGIFVQVGLGTNAFDRYFYCTKGQKGDIISLTCVDAAYNVAQKNYIAVDGEPRLGDADLDGSVTVSDALKALQQAVGLINLGQLSFALSDVDQDIGEITVSDALVILQASVGLREL